MIFDGKPTSEITPADIEAVLRDRIEEDAFVDYKARPYARDPNGIHELVKDVSAFANAQGGYLIIGIGEEAGALRRPGGIVNVEDAETTRRWMIDHCIEKIEPRLPELDIRAIRVNENTVLVCRVPESAQKPHCAKPDREHHYFWRRYEDGNRIMTVPEIRECLEGGRTVRELAELRREFAQLRQHQVVAQEAQREVDEGNVFQLQTTEAFRGFAERQFLQETGDQPYYRLTATPLPVNQLNLRDRPQPLLQLLQQPPQIRPHGWDLSTLFGHENRMTTLGVMRTDIGYKHLRILWNGHTEFWTEIDDNHFRLDGDVPGGQRREHRFMFPYAIVETVANFVQFVINVFQTAGFDGQAEFGLGLYRIRGLYLAPGNPESWGYLRARGDAGHPYGPQPFSQDNLIVPPVTIGVPDLPDQVPWRLVSQVYYRFSYVDGHIPFFDELHNFMLGQPRQQGGAA